MNQTVMVSCWRCGKKFAAAKVSARWCSDACKQEAYRIRKRRDAMYYEAWKKSQMPIVEETENPSDENPSDQKPD